MHDPDMGLKCKHHVGPESGDGDGVCSICLEKKLNSAWRGESKPSDSTAPGTVIQAKHPDLSLHPKEAVAVLGSIASITKRKQVTSSPALVKGRDITLAGMDFVLDSRGSDGVTASVRNGPSWDIVPGGDASVASKLDVTKRRSRVTSSGSKKKVVGKSVALAEAKAGVNAFSGARSVGCRSLPLVDRIAKETALRVIREVGDDGLSESVEGIFVINEHDPRISTCLNSPSQWQTRLRSKWGLIGTPMAGSNKIFPSKSVDVSVNQKLSPLFDSRLIPSADQQHVEHRQRRPMQKRQPHQHQQEGSDEKPSPQVKSDLATRESEHSGVVIQGMPDRILKPEDMNQRLRTSYNTVLKWLEDLPVPDTAFQDVGEGEAESSPSCVASSVVVEIGNRNLVKVGHLHEIAEEHENVDESSVEEVGPTGNHLRDVSSFGKFLIRAAQRKPKQGLSRVAGAR